MEKEILRDKMDGIDSIGKKMTVCQLYEKQNALKPNVRKSTVNGRKQLMDILKADKQEKALLSFVQMDSIYSKYYRAIVILLNTGLRISELCGLTVNDIDFENGFINIDHQIVHDRNGYYIAPPKTENSVRQIPMLECVRKALKEEIRSRKNIQPMLLDGCSNFIFLNQKGYPMYASLYSGMFSSMVKKYNKYNKDKLPKITPHTMRHTFCTNMANRKITPNTLQYIMGHKHISMTLGYYTHGSAASAKAEMEALAA